MSLIVDVLKTAQKDGAVKGPLPQFIKYSHDEVSHIRAFISKYIRLFGILIGGCMFLIVAVWWMGAQDRTPIPEVNLEKGIAATVSKEKTYPIAPEKKKPVLSLKADNVKSEGIAATVSKEKIYPIAPEKKKPVLSSKADNVKSEKHEMQRGIIALEQRLSQDIIHLFGLAVSYQKQGEISKAMEAYIKVIDIEPMNVEAHNNLGVIYKDMGKFNQAIREFRTVLFMIPRQEAARNNLGVIFYLQENLEEAIQEFRKVLDVNNGNRDAYINLGAVYKKQNRIAEAKRMLENALSIDPHCPEVRYNLGLISEENGDIEEAISHYRKFVDFSGDKYDELTVKVRKHLETLSLSVLNK